jgi:hypothetical protein
LFNFADAYSIAAREQHGPQPIPSRLPTENEVGALIDNMVMVKKKLEEVRDMVQQNRINTERARENIGRKGFEDEDIAMYGDGMKQPYSMNEVKKRRGVSHLLLF